MKKLLFIITGIFISFISFSQPCLPEGITFSTQVQVDNFQMNYPGCTEIEGDVTIQGENINNLNGLSILTFIGGNLIIGPDNYWEPALTSLEGLNNITQVAGNVWIGSNYILETLDGLEGLTYIGGRLDIDFNMALTSLTGLANLASIGGALDISDNELLVNLAGLENLTYIGGDLVISLHESLNSLNGLENIIAGSIDDLYIYNNQSLSNCEVQSICNYLTSPNGTVLIQNNAAGCDNPPEVANGCGITLPCLPFGSFIFNTQAEIDNFQANYPGCTNLNGIVAIHGNDIDNLDGLNGVTTIGDDLAIQYNSVLTNVLGLSHLKAIGNSLEIAGNDILASLSGLDSINAGTVSNLYIFGNPALSTCEVQSVCNYLANPIGNIDIHDNATGCNSQLEVEAACGVGLKESNPDENLFSISPNPSSSQITIEILATPTKFQISIFNLNGQEIISQQVTEHVKIIDISHLPGGVYFVRMTGEKTVGIEKFVKVN